ncbi:MAG: hypothetical protein WBN40_04195 [Pseudomonadales bacterium]
MAKADDYNGSVNQALYFARLLASQADALQQGQGDAAFYRQQRQCYCEAALDALYRALYFLVAGEMSQAGAAVSQLLRAPEELEAELEAAARLHPSPMLNELRAALQNGQSLRRMLEAWRSLWQMRVAREQSSELLVAESGITASECHAWREEIAGLFASSRAQGAEY